MSTSEVRCVLRTWRRKELGSVLNFEEFVGLLRWQKTEKMNCILFIATMINGVKEIKLIEIAINGVREMIRKFDLKYTNYDNLIIYYILFGS